MLSEACLRAFVQEHVAFVCFFGTLALPHLLLGGRGSLELDFEAVSFLIL